MNDPMGCFSAMCLNYQFHHPRSVRCVDKSGEPLHTLHVEKRCSHHLCKAEAHMLANGCLCAECSDVLEKKGDALQCAHCRHLAPYKHTVLAGCMQCGKLTFERDVAPKSKRIIPLCGECFYDYIADFGTP